MDVESASFAPRSVALAKKLVIVLTTVAAVVTVVFALLTPAPNLGAWGTVGVSAPVLILVLAVAVVVTPEPPTWLWAAFPLGATTAVAIADVATHDASVTAQIFFFFPVLYAGAQLRRHAAATLCAVTVAGAAVVIFLNLPFRIAAVDFTYLTAALITTTAILVYGGEHVDRLVGKLREQAAIDSLTGLVTRRVLDTAASSALQGADNDGGTALILIDVDHFKSINDEHGHPAGDLVLQHVSGVLAARSRRTDVVSRMGGDEFAVLLPGCSFDTALDRAESLLSSVRQLRVDIGDLSMVPHHDDLAPVAVTVSIGIAHLPTHAADVHELYRAADISLYEAKRAGRDGIGLRERDAA